MVELVNLAAQKPQPQADGSTSAGITDEELKAIGIQAYEDFDEDKKSRADWEAKQAVWRELYYQTQKSDIQPWEGSSDECIPTLTQACTLYQSRAFKAFFPNRDFVRALPLNKTSEEIRDSADRVGKHMSYQLSVLDRNYKRDKNAMFLATARDGCDFSKAFRDPIKQQNRVVRVRSEDFIVPYGQGPRSIPELERMTEIIYMSVNQTKVYAKMGYFTSPCKEYKDDDGKSPQQNVEDEMHGLQESLKSMKSACVLEQHRLLDLDGDGIAEPYIVWLDRSDKSVKRIQVGYEVDEQGNATDPLKSRKEYYTMFGFLPNPDGFYPLGYGHLLAKLNSALNKMLQQSIDAGELANVGNMSGIISSKLGLKGDEFLLKIGAFTKTERSVEDINKSIYTFKFPGPNAGYMEMFNNLNTVTDKIGNTTDVVSGDIDKVMQPMTIQTLLESTLQLPTSIMEQQALSFEEEFEKLYKLNQLYFNENAVFVNGQGEVTITPQDYQNNLHITPIFDPKNVTQQQRIARSQQVFQFVMENPLLAQNAPIIEDATRRVLEAMEVEDMEKLMPPKPQVQRIDDQNEENMLFMLPPDERQPFTVFPDQDHKTHIRIIDALIAAFQADIQPKDAVTDQTTNAVIQAAESQFKQDTIAELMKHRRQHVAFQYGQETGVFSHAKGMGATGSPVAGQQGNPVGNQAPGGQVQSGTGMEGMQPGGTPPAAGPAGSVGAVPLPAQAGITELGVPA